MALELLEDRDCVTCTAVQKKLWGCNGNAQMPVYMMGEEHKTCPRRPLLDQPREFTYWLALFRDYRKGMWPEQGARLDQAAVVLQMFQIMDGVYATIEEHRNNEARKKSRQPSGGARGTGRQGMTG